MSMTGYSKLFGSIITSTIWREDKETKILWITMLALKDKNGNVEGSVPGLADMARLTIEETLEALEKLRSPDPHSRTKENEGRRIEDVDGGWVVLNHQKYRDKMNADERREYLRVKQVEHRAKVSTLVNQRQLLSTPSTPSTHADADTYSEAKTKKKPPNPLKGECDGFDLFWSEYPNKQAKLAAKRAWLKIKPDERADVMSGVVRWKRSESWLKDDGQFIPHPATFLNQRRFEDSPKPKALKKKIYYNHLPPANNMPDSDFVSVRDVARKEMEKLREKLKR